jgi:hypothetical protein
MFETNYDSKETEFFLLPTKNGTLNNFFFICNTYFFFGYKWHLIC